MAKELNHSITTHSFQSINKQWAKGARHPLIQIRMMNSNTEHNYHRIITFIKQQHLKLGEVYFERNYKHDRSNGPFAMHSFVTSSFCCSLDCMLYNHYEVDFAFGNCPYEADIRHLIRGLDKQAFEKPKVDFNAYFNKVLEVQVKRFIHLHAELPRT